MGAGVELAGRHRSGALFPVEISLSSIETEEGPLILAAIRDTTERRRMEQALRDQNAELEIALAAKERFLARMSHELRTPLNAILGFTGTLLMGMPGELNPEQRAQLETVRGAARRLLALINDLLDLARVESGKVELSLEKLDCRPVVDAVAREARPEAEAKGLAFRVANPDEEVLVRADRRVLTQILGNLVGNAVRFTESGAIEIAVLGAGGDSPGTARIEVTDSGPGIAPADLERVFEAFPELHRPAPAEPLTGLGLHLSRLLAGLLGATVTCRSVPGQGSTFTVELERA
jgi:protein-histidine pros-kinase